MDKGVIFDYDKKGRLIGIEILDASKKLSSSFRAQMIKKQEMAVGFSAK